MTYHTPEYIEGSSPPCIYWDVRGAAGAKQFKLPNFENHVTLYLDIKFLILKFRLLEVRRILAHLIDDAIGALLVDAFHSSLFVREDEHVRAIAR